MKPEKLSNIDHPLVEFAIKENGSVYICVKDVHFQQRLIYWTMLTEDDRIVNDANNKEYVPISAFYELNREINQHKVNLEMEKLHREIFRHWIQTKDQPIAYA